MVHLVNTAAVAERIRYEYTRYEKEAYKILQFYAAEMMTYFMQVQGSAPAETKGQFWTNHTFEAVRGFFTKPFIVPGNMGITIANATSYAVYLEENYGKRFAAFPTIIERFYPLIIRDLKILYGDAS